MERFADSTTQLGVDEAILDYLIYNAIKTLLEESKAITSSNIDDPGRLPNGVELSLQMVDCGFGLKHLNTYVFTSVAHVVVQLFLTCSAQCIPTTMEVWSFGCDFSF